VDTRGEAPHEKVVERVLDALRATGALAA